MTMPLGFALAFAKPLDHVEREEQKTSPSSLSTPVLAFSKPPSMSRGRVHDIEEKTIELKTQQMTA
jgi:hypothetical protein